MSTSEPPAEPTGTEPPSDDMLAGEYVLGVLDAAQQRSLEARIGADRAFAERVAYWERRFAPWLAEIAPVEAPDRVWKRVCGRLGWTHDERASSGVWQSLSFWRGVAAISALVAFLAIGLSIVRPPQLPGALRQPALVTPLNHDDGTPAWLASVDRTRGAVVIVPVPAPPDAQGRVPELWLIPAGQAPRSLGMISVDKSRAVAVPADLRAALVSGSVLAISLESPTGVPHAAPSGPIVAKGAIRQEGAG